MAKVLKPVLLDVTGQRIATALEYMAREPGRVTPLGDTVLADGAQIIEAVGIPEYVEDVSEYEGYGLTEPGWYIFARITAREGVTVTSETTVEGAAVCAAQVGDDHIDVAVRFGVASQSVKVTVNWGVYADVFVFKATDLAVRNLDYRTTFYLYDLAPYCTWSYGLTADATFGEGKRYFELHDGAYVDADADIVAGDAVPAAYYVADGESYVRATSELFAEGETYYQLVGEEYVEAEVTPGDWIPNYWAHTALRLEGMVRNVTYTLGTMIDCPITIALPEIPDDGRGAWFELQLRYAAQYSATLVPPAGVSVASDSTPSQTVGLNTLDLHYMQAGKSKVWRLVNTHSTFTAIAAALTGIEFRGLPKTEYAVGEALDLTGAEIIASYEDGHRKLVTATFAPENGTALTAEDTELVATYTEGGVTMTATLPLTVTETETEGVE